MISYLSGKIQSKDLKSLCVNVGGIGYRVYATLRILDKTVIGQEVELYTHLNVREDALELYGFENIEELELFTKLISVSGIGPKSALGVFTIAKAMEIKQAIANGDPALLTRVSGIGKKTADRIIVELRNKIGEIKISGQEYGNLAPSDADAIDALIGLGYSRQQAVESLRQSGEGSVEDRLRQALKILGKK
ncbi:Holliday junction branch migration protein RuvA [Candidatus Parcubacteria bacterium]|nr:Holliday junction branch migration protein RuvA [Patescibacteria group bacterium]MCG2693395.1 Holliday junction branch migration protein RuvA [Candidatus Parcubacteria bacterium]